VDEDFTLLDRWQAGDATAGNQLFAKYFEVVFRFLDRKIDHDVDDLVQDTFLACLRARETFRRHSSFKTFLLAIARNTLFTYWRRSGADRNAIDFEQVSLASLSTSAGSRIAAQEDRAMLLEALRNLPLDQQILVEMYYWEDIDRDALAEIFEVASATIGSRLFRIRQSLQELLESQRGSSPKGSAFDDWARSLKRISLEG
jgi:RNA polymerase sigma factor (sigma-70 family)